MWLIILVLSVIFLLICPVAGCGNADTATRGVIELFQQDHDPAGSPRPGPWMKDVPVNTSFFFELKVSEGTDEVLTDSISVRLQPEHGEALYILTADRTFAPGYSGKFFNTSNSTLGVFIDSSVPLEPSMRYEISVAAKSRSGASLPERNVSWTFTTEMEPLVHQVIYEMHLEQESLMTWHGSFFSGILKPGFTTSSMWNLGYDLMREAQQEYPNAWRLQRDFWLTGFDHEPNPFQIQPNVVREKETRRIVSMKRQRDGVLLGVEDFFGHQQYGIESGRPVSADYHEGDEILVADGNNSVRAHVLATDDRRNTVLVTSFVDPPGGWQLQYSSSLPKEEDPRIPGLFPSGGTYLRKFNPSGTACYYWERVNKEWDIASGEYGRILIPGFNDAPGDLSIDGRAWTTAKDYVQLHEVTYAITSYLIERYGEATVEWRWSILNEPDLNIFWRTDWIELQKFYDYTVDAILRAFEDRGYDSEKVLVGGLELGGIFGTSLRLGEFLGHASPNVTTSGALEFNAAYADPRLDGKRSERVEKLCGANGGRGAPLDFISIHAYNRSKMMADKLIRAKEFALEIDPEYYSELWVSSYESVPAWMPIQDPGAAQMYLGNGYFATWVADVVRRLLDEAARDPRYGYGESVLTLWPWPPANFDAVNGVVRQIYVDDNGDRRVERMEMVPMQIFHVLNLLSTMGEEYVVLPERKFGGHIVSGFASKNDEDIRILLYSHHAQDTQSRSDASFEVALDFDGVEWERVRVNEYRFDKENNTYYELALKLGERPNNPFDRAVYSPKELEKVKELALLRATDSRVHVFDEDNSLTLNLAGNGINFVVIERLAD